MNFIQHGTLCPGTRFFRRGKPPFRFRRFSTLAYSGLRPKGVLVYASVRDSFCATTWELRGRIVMKVLNVNTPAISHRRYTSSDAVCSWGVVLCQRTPEATRQSHYYHLFAVVSAGRHTNATISSPSKWFAETLDLPVVTCSYIFIWRRRSTAGKLPFSLGSGVIPYISYQHLFLVYLKLWENVVLSVRQSALQWEMSILFIWAGHSAEQPHPSGWLVGW